MSNPYNSFSHPQFVDFVSLITPRKSPRGSIGLATNSPGADPAKSVHGAIGNLWFCCGTRHKRSVIDDILIWLDFPPFSSLLKNTP